MLFAGEDGGDDDENGVGGLTEVDHCNLTGITSSIEPSSSSSSSSSSPLFDANAELAVVVASILSAFSTEYMVKVFEKPAGVT